MINECGPYAPFLPVLPLLTRLDQEDTGEVKYERAKTPGLKRQGFFFASGPAVLFVCLHCIVNAGIHATTEARHVDANFGDFYLEGNER